MIQIHKFHLDQDLLIAAIKELLLCPETCTVKRIHDHYTMYLQDINEDIVRKEIYNFLKRKMKDDTSNY